MKYYQGNHKLDPLDHLHGLNLLKTYRLLDLVSHLMINYVALDIRLFLVGLDLSLCYQAIQKCLLKALLCTSFTQHALFSYEDTKQDYSSNFYHIYCIKIHELFLFLMLYNHCSLLNYLVEVIRYHESYLHPWHTLEACLYLFSSVLLYCPFFIRN